PVRLYMIQPITLSVNITDDLRRKLNKKRIFYIIELVITRHVGTTN
ncbi:unnamed protein product, partial [marine sediment metagenome]